MGKQGLFILGLIAYCPKFRYWQKVLKLYINRREILLLVMNTKLENKHSESVK